MKARPKRRHAANDILLAKHQMQRTRPAGAGGQMQRSRQAGTGGAKRPAARRPVKKKGRRPSHQGATQAPGASQSGKTLSKLLSPKNLQQTLKTVGTLRTRVKSWLQYLQQADQVLDTIFVTSSSLRETGVWDKLIKSRGKNLTTDDFTNVLIALMNTPVGSQIIRSFSGGSEESNSETPAGK